MSGVQSSQPTVGRWCGDGVIRSHHAALVAAAAAGRVSGVVKHKAIQGPNLQFQGLEFRDWGWWWGGGGWESGAPRGLRAGKNS